MCAKLQKNLGFGSLTSQLYFSFSCMLPDCRTYRIVPTSMESQLRGNGRSKVSDAALSLISRAEPILSHRPKLYSPSYRQYFYGMNTVLNVHYVL
jgi:hypothetical protein